MVATRRWTGALVLLVALAACGTGDQAAFEQRTGRAGRGSADSTTTVGPTTSVEVGATSSSTPGASTATTRRRSGTPTTVRPATPTTTPGGTPVPTNLRLSEVARLTQPLDLTGRPNDGDLYVAEKGGRVRAIRGGAVDPIPVLDLSTEVSTGGEQGLLGMTFNRDGGRLYVNITDLTGDTRILEFAMVGNRADVGSRRQLLFVDQPFPNHNGGGLQVGPDGFLYIALGDGGSANDPLDNAQNLNTPLGKLVRLDPRLSTPQWQIWDRGLRNPFRFSFDRTTNDIWIGDVGQNAWEEVDFEPANTGARNFGWAYMEGNHRVQGKPAPPDGLTPPVYEYAHGGATASACTVTGGYVYRGTRIPALTGTYVFADFCIGEVWGLNSGFHKLGPSADSIASFGQDNGGELYVVSLDGPVLRIDPA